VKIRKEQLDVFAQAQAEAFAGRLVRFLHRNRAALRDVPLPVLDARVRAQIARAKAHGLVTEWQIAVYVDAALAAGPDFDTRIPAIRDALADGSLHPDAKARTIREHARPPAGEE
jgi:hypothetical protein